MANTLPLYEKTIIKRPTQRALDIAIFFLLLSLVSYRLLLLFNHGFSHLQTIAFLCESWFSFVWFLAVIIKWNPVDYKTYPQRLLKREVELPAVDIFVTTADPVLEPPIITVNTVLSLMALDYPTNKLSCYISDDGCSAMTFYALSETVNFAKMWVPFCKKYEVEIRAPFRYFLNDSPMHFHSSPQFQHDWKTVKVGYERLEGKIKEAEENRLCSHEEIGLGIDLAAFSNIHTKHHPTIIKILWENKDVSDELPHLIYVSREKSLKHHHQNKAGAMNVLTRVSGLLTNAPYILNVDCDMFVNNPQVVLHAMSVFCTPKDDLEDIGYIQSPQCFYDGPEDDRYGNQLVVIFEYFARGIMGLQGPFYCGTGCFHRRKVIYGQFPHHTTHFMDGKASEQEIMKSFGYSKTFGKSAIYAFEETTCGHLPKGPLSNNLEAANQVASCGYEIGTTWGSKIGWMYGSTTEDVLTGLVIQKRGWRSIYIALDPPAFLGCAPSQLVASLTQQKRWASGLLQVLFSKHCPIFATLFGKLQWKQCAAYLWILTWGLRSIPELSYALLPPYCLITDSSFFPTVEERAILIPISLFIIYNSQQLLQYKETGQSIRAWWNNQRMGRVNTMCAWLFGVWNVVLKLLGVRETVFEVTKKETGCEADLGHFTFDESPMFVPGTTILLLQLIALLMSFIRPPKRSGSSVLEVICSVWLVLCFWPFLKGMFMFGKGRSYGLPFSTIYKSGAFALLFVLLCQTTTMI
ncbi:cellulose synthase-like protein H1 isoform X1 [Benincasa hispida]|uniref:cellulose synthase-like protein H1 isoform X1 n=1 Tax=Benincasa hispida TaxID=102211 RepID=UPI0018FFE90A|nr:cellulose synthase-like protein H1 isoform X1 [Benincasa hispida]